MKLRWHDWKALRPAVIFFSVTIILTGSTIWYARQKATDTFQALELQNGKLSQAQQAYLAVADERAAVAKYLPLYRQLVQQGFVGEEQRVEWIDELRDISRQHHLFGINYEIGTQQAFKTQTGTNPNIFLAHRTVMRIGLSLLHEVDLLTVLNVLRTNHDASFMVRSCEIKHVSGVEKNQFSPQLVANCEIDWLTIAKPQKLAGKP